MKRVLMVAYHFPPFAGSSGVQRALRFATYLPEWGWEPIILTAHERAYEHSSDDLLAEVPEGLKVIRASAWDTKRHLSLAGRYPTFMALPDRWRWWWLGAVPAGLVAIRRYRPHALWSTYPIATAHSIAASLARLSGIPWMADFRDPMAQDGYPADPVRWRSYAKLEKLTFERAALATFTTPGAVRLYEGRYPDRASSLRILENGYEESVFERRVGEDGPLNAGRVTLLHSGVVYPDERDPRHLFDALSELKKERPDLFARLVVRFRSPGHDGLLRELIQHHDVGNAVEVLPPISHSQAVNEICRADGLLLLQASNCNAQVPAKFYEYVRAQRPMLLLTDRQGDTATAARSAGITAIAGLGDSASIRSLLTRFLEGDVRHMLPRRSGVERASRRARTREFANLLEELSARRAD